MSVSLKLSCLAYAWPRSCSIKLQRSLGVKSTKFFITLVIIASVNVPWPTFGQDAVEGTLTKFQGTPDVVEVDDLKGDKMAVEANGASVLVSIFSSLGNFKPQTGKKTK